MSNLHDIKRIEKLMALFRGSENAYGVFIETINNDPLKPKIKGKAATVPQGPTIKQWEAHYLGQIGLGIIPINAGSMCYWGCLDVDGELDSNRQQVHHWDCLNKDGTVNHVKLQTEIQKHNLPLVCCYSKSKSSHCFLFVEEPIPAQAMRSLLEEMSSKIGVGGCEIFPKQDKLEKEKGGLGNWLNMPYFGDTRRGILLKDGIIEEQDIDTFLSYAYNKRLSKQDLDSIIGNLRTDIDALEEVLAGAPPCLQHLLQHGIPTGSRNSILFNVAVYCRKRYGEDFRTEFSKLHDKFCDEPLGFKELENICVSAEKTEYQYQCKEPMLKKYCNANVCMDRDCGIDFSSEIKTLKSATRILSDPVIYAVEVEMGAGLPHTVYVETDQLFNQEQFRKECSIQLHKTFIPISMKAWNAICVRLINTAVNQEPPYEMSEHGQMFKLLQEYLVNRAQSRKTHLSEEEGVYHDTSAHKIYFRLEGFKSYLTRKGVINQNYSKWKLNKKIEGLMIMTDEINLDTGISVKKNLGIKEERIRIGKGLITVRSVDDAQMKLEEIVSMINEEEVV